jgi:hypothetical protein
VRYAPRREQDVAHAESVLLVLDPQAKLPLQNVEDLILRAMKM